MEIDETLTGWNVQKKCDVCKDSTVFVHNSKNKERAMEAVNIKFNEIHLDCKFKEVIDESNSTL